MGYRFVFYPRRDECTEVLFGCLQPQCRPLSDGVIAITIIGVIAPSTSSRGILVALRLGEEITHILDNLCVGTSIYIWTIY